MDNLKGKDKGTFNVNKEQNLNDHGYENEHNCEVKLEYEDQETGYFRVETEYEVKQEDSKDADTEQSNRDQSVEQGDVDLCEWVKTETKLKVEDEEKQGADPMFIEPIVVEPSTSQGVQTKSENTYSELSKADGVNEAQSNGEKPHGCNNFEEECNECGNCLCKQHIYSNICQYPQERSHKHVCVWETVSTSIQSKAAHVFTHRKKATQV